MSYFVKREGASEDSSNFMHGEYRSREVVFVHTKSVHMALENNERLGNLAVLPMNGHVMPL